MHTDYLMFLDYVFTFVKEGKLHLAHPVLENSPKNSYNFSKNLCLSDPISLVDVVLYLVGLYLKKVDVLSKNKVLFFFTVSGSVAVTIGA